MEFKNDVEQVEAPHRLSISEKDMKGDVDAAVKTVQNQDLNFTPEGKSELRGNSDSDADVAFRESSCSAQN